MSTKQEKRDVVIAEQNAARMLLVDYITKNPQEIAFALERIIPFFVECSLSGLKSSMNTVNMTFASVALNVIKSIGDAEDEEDRQFLPVDAEDMKSAIYYLSKIVDLLGPLSALCSKDAPAIKMCRDAFSKYENV